MSRVAIHVESNFSELRQCRLGPSNYADILIMNIFDTARNAWRWGRIARRDSAEKSKAWAGSQAKIVTSAVRGVDPKTGDCLADDRSEKSL
jgi:hypothetical protein